MRDELLDGLLRGFVLGSHAVFIGGRRTALETEMVE
jgi:hypothetical protein